MKKLALWFYAALSLMMACGQAADDEIFFLRHKGADMQLWVRGNVESRVFVLYLHGGPGASSFPDALNNYFTPIEREYAVVYWEQRASGTAQGHSSVASLTIDQYKEDLGLVVQLLKQKYDNPDIVLMGHSWGGLLGPAWLLEPGNQSLVRAWIEIDGAHDLSQESYQLSEDYVLEYANARLQQKLSQEDRDFWNDALKFYRSTSMWSAGVIAEHAQYVRKAGGYYRDRSYKPVRNEELFLSPADFIGAGAQAKTVTENMKIWGVDLTDRLHEITLPTLLLWGKLDGILPVAVAHEAKDAYGLPDERMVIFETAGHSPFVEENAHFNRTVLNFLNEIVQ